MTRAAAVTAYRLISGAVLAGAITLCVAAWHLGTERTGRATAYFYEVFDIGHPGIVNAVTSMALVAVATISVMLGLSTGLTPWLVNAALFLVLAADNVLRLTTPTSRASRRGRSWPGCWCACGPCWSARAAGRC